jgi:hypothetical protein
MHARIFVGCVLAFLGFLPGGRASETGWKPLFNGKDLDGWHIVIRNGRSDDPEHLVQIHDGVIHMYKDAPPGSQQPNGYIVTERDYGNYHLRLEYKWGAKKFIPKLNAKRDAGLLYHVVGKDGVWPRSVECQIQEGDVGDIFTVNTRLIALVDQGTTNFISKVVTNDAGVLQTNRTIQPVFLEAEKGGITFVRGVANGITRVIRNPMNEHDGWNTVEVIVRGNNATYVVNGQVNNKAANIQELVANQWVPLARGRLALQLEGAEVFYRHIEIKDLED